MALERWLDGFRLVLRSLLLLLVVVALASMGPTVTTTPTVPAPIVPAVLVPSVGSWPRDSVGRTALIAGLASSSFLFRAVAFVGSTGSLSATAGGNTATPEPRSERSAASPTGAGEVIRDLTLRSRCIWIRSLVVVSNLGLKPHRLPGGAVP